MMMMRMWAMWMMGLLTVAVALVLMGVFDVGTVQAGSRVADEIGVAAEVADRR